MSENTPVGKGLTNPQYQAIVEQMHRGEFLRKNPSGATAQLAESLFAKDEFLAREPAAAASK